MTSDAGMLNVERLSLAIGGASILSDVSFDVRPGEVFGLAGESGSGKTMTALSVMRLLPRGGEATGRIFFEGQDLSSLGEAGMCGLRGRRIGMIFQEPMAALNPVRTIGDQVAETLIVHGAATRAEALEAASERLARVCLGRFGMDRYPHELSGGQRQRVCIAMAIALRPRLLIADEPTTALDVTTQARILSLLKDLVAEEGMALWLITHDLAVVAEVTDRLAVMRNGRIVEAGQTERLFRRRSHAYTRKLFANGALAPARASKATGRPVLEVRGAVREYPLKRAGLFGPAPAFRAVENVSMEVREGESVGLVGQSGCGKSTLARAILGIDSLQAGEIRVDGDQVDARDVPDNVRRKMQAVFQDPYGSFNPRHKVRRLVAEPLHLLSASSKDAGSRVAEALEAVGLASADGEKYIHEFSGGQRQRIAIARAIVTRPKLVILDEAVSALDFSVRAQILDLLAELQARFHQGHLLISHDLSVVRNVTDRVVVMREGRVVEQGETEAVFANPKAAYTRELIAAAPRIPESWLAA